MTFENINTTVDKVAKILNWTPEQKKKVLTHERIQQQKIKAGKKTYQAYRIIHNNALGPGKGGIRYHPDVSLDEVKSLSFWMSVKNSLSGLPFGGAKGGITVNPKNLSQKELEELSRNFVKAFHKHMGQDVDIPAPDVYTNPQIMSWMLDEFEKIKGKHEPGFITGKPIALGGIPLRNDSTSYGGFIILNELFQKTGMKKPRIAVQGFGNAGYYAAKFLHDNKYNVVAVSDSQGGIYNDKGLDINAIHATKENKGSVTKYPGKIITNEELLELPVDILVLAALENQITEKNAGNIKAKYVIELANGPVNAKADEILFKRNIIVVPDILANSGGVVGSYFEWVQNRVGQIFTHQQIHDLFVARMKHTFKVVYEEYTKRKCDMRTASYIIALNRILEAENLRGRI